MSINKMEHYKLILKLKIRQNKQNKKEIAKN